VTAAKNVIAGYVIRVDSRRQKAEAAADRRVKLTMEQKHSETQG
jgi:lipopolysaccharide export system protein LptA